MEILGRAGKPELFVPGLSCLVLLLVLSLREEEGRVAVLPLRALPENALFPVLFRAVDMAQWFKSAC